MHLKNRNLGPGFHRLVDRKKQEKASFMNIDLDLWNALINEELDYQVGSQDECAILLINGEADFYLDSEKISMARSNIFEQRGKLLLLKAGQKIQIFTKKPSKFLFIITENSKLDQNYFYDESNSREEFFGSNQWEQVARRKVRTFFDYYSNPKSNLVVGEVVTYQGKWSSYLPHYHPQPEMYFFQFERDSAFGLSVNGDQAYIVKNDDVNAIQGGLVHPVSAAPGYPLYYCWIIRHLENNPWIDRIEAHEHLWLNQENPNYWKEKDEI